MKPDRSLARRFFVSAVVVFVLYSVVGFLIAPPLLKTQLTKRLSMELDRPVRITKVRLNPWVLSLAIEGLAITDKNGEPLVGWSRVFVNFDSSSAYSKEWRFQEITATAPSGRVVVNKDRSLNFTDLIEKFAKPTADDKPGWPLRVAKVVVSGAQLDFIDHSRGEEFKTRLGPVNFSLVEFRTAPNRDAPYQFTAQTETGEKLRWVGTVSVVPLASEGELAVQGIALGKYAPYYHDFVQFDILGGTLDVTSRYKVSLHDKIMAGQLSEGHVHLTGFKAGERGSNDAIVELNDLELTGVAADAITMKVSATKVALTGGRVNAHRAQDGSIDLLQLLQPVARPANSPAAAMGAAGSPTASAPPGKPAPQLDVAEISVRQFAATFEDHVTARVATQTIDNADLDVQKFTLAAGASIPVHANLTLANRGSLKIEGNVVIAPLQATLAVDATSLSLATVSAYVEPLVNVRVTEGALTAKGDATIRLPDKGGLEVTYKGDLKVDRFGVVDGVANEPLAGWSELTLSNVDFTSVPLGVTVKEVTLTAPSAHVIVNRDKSINVVSVLADKKKDAAEASPAVTVPAAPAELAKPTPKIEIGNVVINEGAFTFTDRSVAPEVQTKVDHFGGTVTGLSSLNPGRGDVALRATVGGGGPITITGILDPLGPQKVVDLQVDLKDVELTPFSPYTGKFAGYELARGKLFLSTKASVANEKVDMTNAITLSQFTLGAPTNSPDATKLPVRLAVALLKDREGKIALDVPVQGSLTDPQFRIGGVIMHVIGNVLTKAAVSPFSLLGAMFGGGGDELAFQDFIAGDVQLAEGNMPKLETLTKALKARPALNLEISGSYDAASDGAALRQRRLARTLRSALWDERRQVDASVPPPDQLEVTPEQERAMILKLYRQRLPLGTSLTASDIASVEKTAAPSPPPSPVANKVPDPQPENKSFLQRAAEVVTLKPIRDWFSKKKAEQPITGEAVPAGRSPVSTARPTDAIPLPEDGPPLEEMRARLAETIQITDGDLRQLAAARAQTIRDYFSQHEINPERLFLANVPGEGKGARVFLQLQ
ncbi:MAG: DUF748 domain-containing protein [Opitutus sp.]